MALGDGMYQDGGSSYSQQLQFQQQLAKQKADQEAAAAEAHHKAMAAQNLNDDGSPIRQAFDSLVDPTTGKLKEGYTMNQAGIDPTKFDGYSKYKSEALRTGPSNWANLQTQQNNLNALNNKENATTQAQSSMNQGNSSLAMKGGLSDGARAFSANSSARDMLMARQQAQRAGDTANLGTATTDEGNRINQLASLSTSEQDLGKYNNTLSAKQQEFNINNMTHEADAKRAYNDNTYNQQMSKWAADKQATATQNSGSGGGGGCCFIFLEARYGTGAMDKVVRRFRDENMTDQNKRGYYKLSEVLVPMMRKSLLVKGLVRVLMTDPLVSYGKWHYEKKGFGFLFAPIKTFWLGAFNYLGGDHPFIRENGETI